jgi:hypothetical protein
MSISGQWAVGSERTEIRDQKSETTVGGRQKAGRQKRQRRSINSAQGNTLGYQARPSKFNTEDVE